MPEDLVKSQATFGIHLDGESQIDAMLLSKTIHDMAELAKLAATEENPDAYLKMNVTAFRNGSFQIDFSAICETAKTLIVPASSATTLASSVVSTIKGFFEIKKLLKGEKPKSVTAHEDKIEIENHLGEIITTSKSSQAILNNCKIDQLVVNVSNNIIEHNPNGGFDFISDGVWERFETSDINGISKPIPIEEEILCKRSRIKTELPIRKAALVGRSAWEFTYNGKSISAPIADDEWINEVNSGDVALRSGDYIVATLEIYVDLDRDGKPIDKSEKYTVLKVHGGIQPQNEFPQQSL